MAALGDPEDLASQYVTDNLLTRAQVARSPWLFLQSLFRWAGLSIVGSCILMSSLIGYYWLDHLSCARSSSHLIHSDRRMWLLNHSADPQSFSLRLGFSSVPVDGREVLGWWLIPSGWPLAGGLACSLSILGVGAFASFGVRCEPAKPKEAQNE